MTKRILFFTALLSTMLLGLPHVAQADSNIALAEVEVLPEGIGANNGFLNATNTGFRVNVELLSGYKPERLGLFVGTNPNSVDLEVYDNSSKYILSSGTSSLAQLKSLLLNHSGKEEGANQITIKGITGEQSDILYQGELISDFSAPRGQFKMQGITGYAYKVEDQIPIIFTPDDSLDAYAVSASINDRELTFVKQGSDYVSTYRVQEGDPDLSTEAHLANVEIFDQAGNKTEYSELTLPINFSVDANSPALLVYFPDEGQVINRSTLKVQYSASDYKNLTFYLNDRVVNDLDFSDLATGSYVLRIVAVDEAGNEKVESRNFSVDITAPLLIIEDGNKQIFESEDLLVSGRSEALSRIVLTLDGSSYEQAADPEGKFSFVIKGLKVASYKCWITAFDEYGNQVTIDLGSILVTAGEQVSQGVTVAEVPVARDYTENEPISLNKELTVKVETSKEQEVAKEGEIISAFDQRGKRAINYMPWIIAIALLIFSVAISSAGYYGLSLVGSHKQKSAVNEQDHFEQEISKISVNIEQTDAGAEYDEPEEPSDKLRW